MRFESILIANRGEIACRIIRTAKSLGYRTIAVYSEADASAPHVALAHEAVGIGPAPVGQSYLSIGNVIGAATASGASAIHPGYGFLSENADFAAACVDSGISFIGPDAESIALMGNKAAAKRHMQHAGVPCLPGYHGEDQSDEALLAAAADVGYPLMVKAAAGGGGRGMRLVGDAQELDRALELARSESLGAFGSDELILERAVFRPRHVEVQVMADQHGNTIHLGERDCSVQRRHQKVIEESPCPVMTPELRDAMGRAAVSAAESIGYRGAGTVEFLLDESGDFFFMEMNTRLQVEHPVTEMVTGLDLVAAQIRIAEGERLDVSQEQVELHGHAIEVRLYAEDPAAGFLPDTGPIEWLRFAEGPHVRVDAGVQAGDDVSPYYDPMIAKVIAWGEDREGALRRLSSALSDTVLVGPATNRDFLVDAISRPAFLAGEATTAFVDDEYPGGFDIAPDARSAAVAAAVQCAAKTDASLTASLLVSRALVNWSSNDRLASRFRFESRDEVFDANVKPDGQLGYDVVVNDSAHRIGILERNDDTAVLDVDGARMRVRCLPANPDTLHVVTGTMTSTWTDTLGRSASADGNAISGHILAPMHGLLLELNVKPGDNVSVGDKLLVLEAMKMQHELRAGVAGTVTSVHAGPGTQVAAESLIVEIETGETA
ncbi:MAG: acetyl-CoA carboxylase biotin carboxylase subunit [Woeseiaceae bacterium]|nr:acetyl-CoA carboxylase biotin carboxylase subunit [Woeseiaceae bacterium]